MLEIWSGTYLEVGMVTRKFNECRLGFITASGCGLLSSWRGYLGFSELGKKAIGPLLQNRLACGPCRYYACRTPAHRSSPTTEEVREVDNALWEGGSRWNNKQRLDDCASQEGWSTTITHASRTSRGYFALEARQKYLEPWSDMDKFPNGVRKTWRINSFTCLREYIHNVSDKYSIAEFYFKFNQSSFSAYLSRSLQCSTGETYHSLTPSISRVRNDKIN